MTKAFRKLNKNNLLWAFLLVYVILMIIISNYRDMTNDETLYFHETYLISQLFREGKWIGNYGVGIHGFLFKIPPALIFLVSGPSVDVVTIYNILLSGITGILSYKLFLFILKNKSYALLSTVFLLSNFHFVLSVPTYLREIPSILVILLLLNNIIKKNNKIILSLLFVLLLDVKEYIFFIFVLFYVVWLFIDSKEEVPHKKLFEVIRQSFIVFIPSFIWMVLMFTTSIIPVNMFLASTIGLKDSTFSYLVSHFDTEVATDNLLEGGRRIPLIVIDESWAIGIKIVLSSINTLLLYVGKVLYPRSFSFLSVPKVVIFPVVCSSILILRKFLIKKSKGLKFFAMLGLLILVWLLIFILRASHGRYLLPIVPVIAVMYVFLLFKQKLTKKQKIFMLTGTGLYVLAGFYFEISYIILKVIIELSIFIIFLISLLKPKVKILKYLLVVIISLVSFGTALLFSYSQGQIYGYTEFGENRSAVELSSILPANERYWINNKVNQATISVFKGETYLSPDWKWELHDSVPKKRLLMAYGEKESFTFRVLDIQDFKSNLQEFDIRKIVLIVTDVESVLYKDQDYLDIFFEEDWLEFEKKEDFKNMTIYIFDMKE